MQNIFMKETRKKTKITLARFAIRTLAISASTLAIFDLLKGEIQTFGILVVGWLAIVIAEKRMFNSIPIDED